MAESIITRILPHAKVKGRYISVPTTQGLQFLLATTETSEETESWAQDYMGAAHLLTSEERRTLCDNQKAKFLRLRRAEAA